MTYIPRCATVSTVCCTYSPQRKSHWASTLISRALALPCDTETSSTCHKSYLKLWRSERINPVVLHPSTGMCVHIYVWRVRVRRTAWNHHTTQRWDIILRHSFSHFPPALPPTSTSWSPWKLMPLSFSTKHRRSVFLSILCYDLSGSWVVKKGFKERLHF